jgi:hypothetical protein
MSRKIDRATHGPGWFEVIFGAVLSAVLGVVLGAVLLVLRPVVTVKELPKESERDPHAVYYVQGSRDTTKATQATAKRKAFIEGQSVTVTEDELNTLAGPAPAPLPAPGAKPVPKPAPKPADKPGAAPEGVLVAGTPNFRLRDGAMQVAVPMTVNALGMSPQFIVQTRGNFVKQGEIFVFEPETLLVGSCPLQKLPFVADYVRDKFWSAQRIPEDIKATWAKLANVSVENDALKLTMP